MLIIFAFFLALMASIFSDVAISHDNMSTSQIRTPILQRRRPVILNYQDPSLRFGHESFCTSPDPFQEIASVNQTYMVADCDRLIHMLRGDDGRYGGWWLVEDLECKPDGDYWWAMVAGWKSCNFAVVTPDCPSHYSA